MNFTITGWAAALTAPLVPLAPVRTSNLFYFPIRLQQLFGENPEFNEDMALAMKLKMIEELGQGEKREYMSAPGT